MDSQRRFEGPDLQALLAEVQQEYGDSATIVEANKLRSGGIGGFFTRERFEVIVATDAEVPDAATETATAATQALANALQSTGSKTSPRRISTTPTVWDGSTGEPTMSAPASPSAPLSHLETAVMAAMEAAGEPAAPTAPTAASILELAEQRNAQEAAILTRTNEPVSEPTVSTEKPAFAEMLGNLAREALSQQADAATDEPFVPLAPPVIETQPAPVIAPQAVAAPEPVSPAPAPMVPTTAAVELRPQAVAPMSPVGAALTCLGLPDHLLPATHVLSELRTELVAALRWLPVADPIPTGTGSVIAVVGNADHAMGMAQQLARELGCDEEEIILAGELADDDRPSWMQLRDVAEATDRRRSWRRRSTPTVVAVAAPFGYDPAVWARPMLDALEPTIAWGVVGADRKAEDVRAWIDRLGGVDALALTDTALTVSPATMLQLGIPIARLDGDRADPMRWANLLLGRLAA